jgi:hypothetical protein
MRNILKLFNYNNLGLYRLGTKVANVINPRKQLVDE